MGLYEVSLSMSSLGFGIGSMFVNFHICYIMLVFRAVFNMLVRNASQRVLMCFRRRMFSLLGPCELLFLLCFIASWTWVMVNVMLYPCDSCVALFMDLFILWVACLWIVWWNNSQYVWVWLLFCCRILWKCLVWVKVLCWLDRVWSSKEYACCVVCDPSVHQNVPSIGIVYVFVCQKLSPHLRSWELDHRCLLSLCI